MYCRISRDKVGAGLGVERQERDCRELAARLGVDIVAVHTDNDLSAYSGKPRPGYKALLAQVRDGHVDIVLCWHTDRLHRRPIELEEWISVCEPRSVSVHTVKAGPLDLATPSGRMVARQLGAVARYEVEHAIERQKAAKSQAAADGRWRGGRRPYGYDADGVTVRPAEAAVVADATGRVLAGESLHAVARSLNDAGTLTSTGRAWTPTELRKVLLRGRNAGQIEHNGDVVGEAVWEAIVDPAAWRNLRRLLTEPGRRPPRSHDLVWLGSGVYLCGVCGDGTTMLSASARSGSKRRVIPSYRCRRSTHVARAAAPLDEFISMLVVERLSQPDARRLLVPQPKLVDVAALHARRVDVDGRLAEVAALFADGAVTAAQLAEVTRRLRGEAEDLDGRIAAATATSPLAGLADAVDVPAAWAATSVARRKAVIRDLMTVTLDRAPRGRPRGWRPGKPYLDRSAVRVVWRHSVG